MMAKKKTFLIKGEEEESISPEGIQIADVFASDGFYVVRETDGNVPESDITKQADGGAFEKLANKLDVPRGVKDFSEHRSEINMTEEELISALEKLNHS